MAEAANIDLPGSRPQAAPKVSGRAGKAGGWTSSFRESHARTDLKWIFGLPFTLWLGLFLAALSLFLATGRENATETIAAMQERILAQPQLTGDLPRTAPDFYAFLASPEFATAVYENPGLMQEKINAIPDYPPGEQVRPEAQDEESAAGRGSPGAGLRQTLGFYSTPVKLLNDGVHTTSGAIITVLLVLLLTTGIPYLLLSRRLGRLVSAGMSTAIVSWPTLGLLALLDTRIAAWLAQSRQASGEEEGKRIIADIMQPFVDGVLGTALSTYRLFALMAVLSFAAAASGLIYRRVRGRKSVSAAASRGRLKTS